MGPILYPEYKVYNQQGVFSFIRISEKSGPALIKPREIFLIIASILNAARDITLP